MRILYIEDNPDDFLLVQRLLHQMPGRDYHLEERADRLAAGLARLAQGGIDVVLLDLKLPDGQGAELVAQLQPFTVPIVVITGALIEKDTAIEAIQRGAQDYLLKNQLTADCLERSIRCAIERKRMEQQLREAKEALETKVQEIEALNHIMMDREERILELKAEIKQLKEQLHIQEGKPESS